MKWILITGLLIGGLIGLFSGIEVPSVFHIYLSVTVLAAIDALLGALRATMKKEFDERLLLSGLSINLILALSLAFLGNQLGVDLYLAAIFAFGIRVFRNIATIRRIWLGINEK